MTAPPAAGPVVSAIRRSEAPVGNGGRMQWCIGRQRGRSKSGVIYTPRVVGGHATGRLPLRRAGSRVTKLRLTGRSAAASSGEACADGPQPAAGDRLFLHHPKRLAEVPAVEPGAAQRPAELEVRFECGENSLERV